jgi:hypothetical protein
VGIVEAGFMTNLFEQPPPQNVEKVKWPDCNGKGTSKTRSASDATEPASSRPDGKGCRLQTTRL